MWTNGIRKRLTIAIIFVMALVTFSAAEGYGYNRCGSYYSRFRHPGIYNPYVYNPYAGLNASHGIYYVPGSSIVDFNYYPNLRRSGYYEFWKMRDKLYTAYWAEVGQ